MSDWYYLERGSIRDETVGPIDTETLAKRIRRGEIKPETPVSSPQKTGNKWVTIAAFPKLVEIHTEGEQARTRERERQKEAKKEEYERRKQAKVAAKQEKALIKQQERSAKLEKQREQALAQRNNPEGKVCTGELLPPQPAGSPVQADVQAPVIQQPAVQVVNSSGTKQNRKQQYNAETTLYESHPSMFRNNPIGFILSIVLIAISGLGLLILLIWWLKVLGTRLILTDKRVTLRKGIFSKHTNQVYHTDIRSVQVSQSIFQRMYGVGTIGIASAGHAGVEIEVSGLPNPQKIKEIIDQHRS